VRRAVGRIGGAIAETIRFGALTSAAAQREGRDNDPDAIAAAIGALGVSDKPRGGAGDAGQGDEGWPSPPPTQNGEG
jgi:hypothetical protein